MVPDGREGKLISSALVGEANHNEVPIAITKIRAIATLAKFLYLILGFWLSILRLYVSMLSKKSSSF